jgi:hypothetical protein
MLRRLALLVALGVVCATGCTPVETVQSSSWLPGRRLFQGPTGPDVVQIRIALVECCPAEADWRYITDELWQFADESLIDEDHRQAMSESGFRVGRVAAQPPAKLLTLLTSQRSNPNPHDWSFRAGNPRTLTIGPPLPHCRYMVSPEGDAVELNQADCKLVVVAARAAEGKTRLRVTPQVVHGDAKPVYRVDEQAGSFISQPERSTESYAAMAWEAELGLNEYLVVGGSYERTETLGHQFFVRPDEALPVQRLLVIQMGAGPQAAPPPPPSPAHAENSRWHSIPLALLATRGTAP